MLFGLSIHEKKEEGEKKEIKSKQAGREGGFSEQFPFKFWKRKTKFYANILISENNPIQQVKWEER